MRCDVKISPFRLCIFHRGDREYKRGGKMKLKAALAIVFVGLIGLSCEIHTSKATSAQSSTADSEGEDAGAADDTLQEPTGRGC